MPDPEAYDFTTAQAQDLANYFLGRGWLARIVDGEFHLIPPNNRMPYDGHTWRMAFRAAGVKLPLKRQIVNVGATVMDGEQPIASARSANQANRIARALNFYLIHNPDAA